MANATIPLAKSFTPGKLRFPVFLSRKVDGVPVRINLNAAGNFTVRSRQNEVVLSVGKLVAEFVKGYLARAELLDLPMPVTLVGEVAQRGDPDADFKDTSGIVRRQYDQSDLLEIWLFEANNDANFQDRMVFLQQLSGISNYVFPVYNHIAMNESEVESQFKVFTSAYPKAEGMVARSHDDPWSPGKRSWGYQKLLNEPTIDLRVVGFEEAVSKDGEPKGMVGRVIVSYNGEEIGCGPGKLTHKERTDLWNLRNSYFNHGNCIAQIKYKKDDSYKALRQPTFQYWRPDKETPDA